MLILYYDIFDRNIEKTNDDILRSTQRAFESEMTEPLKINRYSPTFIPYTTVDTKGIVNIQQINNPCFRNILTNKDIVRAIKESDATMLANTTKQSKQPITQPIGYDNLCKAFKGITKSDQENSSTKVDELDDIEELI